MVNSVKTSAAEAALLLAPMITGILVETRQAAIRLARLPFNIAQVADALTPEIIHCFMQQQWSIFLAIVLIMIVGPLVYFGLSLFCCPIEPEKGFALLLLPDFESPFLPNLEMLSSLAHFLRPNFREKD
jgi:hypothetical protein